ncbi:MAG: UDP-N-acetylmuramyl peptide synthase [Proteobacteria bacterium]|nr:UDP-N-acetylmuramyl peptide synthase [Pseudomonadota bacterium]
MQDLSHRIKIEAELINKNAEMYYQAALALSLPAEKMLEIDGFCLRLGKKNYYFRGATTPFNYYSSSELVHNKYSTNYLLAKHDIPVPKGVCISAKTFKEKGVRERIKNLTFPLVAKPTVNGSKGLDVLCNIKTLEQLEDYLHQHFSKYEFITIEEFHGNLNSYRVFVFNKKILGVIQRYPSFVIGDGQHSIEELIELTNVKRQKTADFLGKIVVDEECKTRLLEANLTLNDIPSLDQRVLLGYTSNATRGGTFRSLGNRICKENKKLMIKAASIVNLNMAGLDVECEDINVPISSSRGVIIEINNSPSIRIHQEPLSGEPVFISKKIIRSLACQHPFSYLSILYTYKYKVLVRTIISLVAMGLIFKLII